MPQPRIGLALGSGGARGLAHCGVLRAFEEAGIRPNVVAGTSMGAIVGALYAQEPNAASVWRKLQTYVEDERFASYWAAFGPRHDGDDEEPHWSWGTLFDYMQRGRAAVRALSTISAERRERLWDPLAKLFRDTPRFDQLALPFAAVGLDLVAGENVTFTRGSVVEALYASCAIPGVFPPIERDGQVLVDGGGPYRVPVEACRSLGAEFVVAVDIPAYHDSKLNNGLDLTIRSNAIALDRLNEFVCATADTVVRPEVASIHWADFRSGTRCRDLGYAAAMASIPDMHSELAMRSSLTGGFQRLLDRLPRLLV